MHFKCLNKFYLFKKSQDWKMLMPPFRWAIWTWLSSISIQQVNYWVKVKSLKGSWSLTPKKLNHVITGRDQSKTLGTWLHFNYAAPLQQQSGLSLSSRKKKGSCNLRWRILREAELKSNDVFKCKPETKTVFRGLKQRNGHTAARLRCLTALCCNIVFGAFGLTLAWLLKIHIHNMKSFQCVA